MPATKSRISASSSTIKISEAMSLPTHRRWLFRLRLFFTGSRKSHAHPGPPLARNFFTGVTQLDAAAMLLDDPPDDCQPQSRALFACRHVRFEETAPVRFGKAYAVIDHVDHDVVAITFRKNVDRALAEIFGRNGRDRLSRVLDDVGERL